MHTTYKKNEFIKMINSEFEDFEKDKSRDLKLKSIIDFGVSSIEYNGTKINTEITPIFSKKFRISVYTKIKNSKKRSLF
jgi:hypothetical protein